MEVLKLFFKYVSGHNKPNWLSTRFHRWKHSKRDTENLKFREGNDKHLFFHTGGGGDIALSKSCHHRTGGVVGFQMSMEWGDFGFFGSGVLGRDEAKRMANFILEQCDNVTETMEEEYQRRSYQMRQGIPKTK